VRESSNPYSNPRVVQWFKWDHLYILN
jgi:hypothetical protein